MSWDAWLHDDRGHSEGWWNYTHNTSGMVYAVLEDAGVVLPASTRLCKRRDPETGEWVTYPDGYGSISWWEHLDGMSGPEGAAFLHVIITGLEADPDRFRAMNPPNGWGDYGGILKTLREMRQAVPEWPTTWGASG